MRRPRSTQSLVPEYDVTVHIVLDDFGSLGRAYRETDEAEADEATIIDHILSGQYRKPLRVVALNTVEGWARDVSEDIARAVLKRAKDEGRQVGDGTRGFLELHLGDGEISDIVGALEA